MPSPAQEFANKLADLLNRNAPTMGAEATAEVLREEQHVVALTTEDGQDLFLTIQES